MERVSINPLVIVSIDTVVNGFAYPFSFIRERFHIRGTTAQSPKEEKGAAVVNAVLGGMSRCYV